jgi:hypothetical protein
MMGRGVDDVDGMKERGKHRKRESDDLLSLWCCQSILSLQELMFSSKFNLD